jgi:hypothetical protein
VIIFVQFAHCSWVLCVGCLSCISVVGYSSVLLYDSDYDYELEEQVESDTLSLKEASLNQA